jgi:hypothetical protein
MGINLSFWLGVAFWLTGGGHPIHISLTEVNHNPGERTLEISHRIFIDDLQDAIERGQQAKTHLATPQEAAEAEKHIRTYLEQRFGLLVNGQAVRPRYLGREYETDAVWVHAEVPNVAEVKTLRVTDRILLELFDDQANIVNVRVGEQRKSLRLAKDDETGSLEF